MTKFSVNTTISSTLATGCRTLRQLLIGILGLVFIYSVIFERCMWMKIIGYDRVMQYRYNISANVHIVDLYGTTTTKFQCIKTKTLLVNLTTSVCLYATKRDRYVSGAFSPSASIWEEQQVTRLLNYLTRHPQVHLIDVGANIGTYTMYAAALGRFVLAIDCFAPNLLRLRRAIQLTNLHDQVVLIQNALFNQSGQLLRLSFDTINVGGQGIHPTRKHQTRQNASVLSSYVVRTITFDEVLPILVARGVRRAVIKMDIEGSEGFAIQTASRIFETVDILWVQMEWTRVRRYTDQMGTILHFFSERRYDPLNDRCQILNTQQHSAWPDEIYWLKRNTTNFC